MSVFFCVSICLIYCSCWVFCTTKQVDEEMRVVKVEFFFDPGQLLGGLLKGASLDGSAEEAASNCPVLRKTG
jgi:hypothetical protein